MKYLTIESGTATGILGFAACCAHIFSAYCALRYERGFWKILWLGITLIPIVGVCIYHLSRYLPRVTRNKCSAILKLRMQAHAPSSITSDSNEVILEQYEVIQCNPRDQIIVTGSGGSANLSKDLFGDGYSLNSSPVSISSKQIPMDEVWTRDSSGKEERILINPSELSVRAGHRIVKTWIVYQGRKVLTSIRNLDTGAIHTLEDIGSFIKSLNLNGISRSEINYEWNPSSKPLLVSILLFILFLSYNTNDYTFSGLTFTCVIIGIFVHSRVVASSFEVILENESSRRKDRHSQEIKRLFSEVETMSKTLPTPTPERPA